MIFSKSSNANQENNVNFFKTRVMVIDEQDKHMWALVTEVPKININVAYGCALLNIFLPGFGTLLAACSSQTIVSKTQIAIGII